MNSFKLTAAELRSSGFTIQPATDAVDCTEISHSAPFWMLNPSNSRLETHPEEILDLLKPAREVAGRYKVTIAGVLPDERLEQFIFVDRNRLIGLQLLHARIDGAHRAMTLASQQLEAAKTMLLKSLLA